MRSDDVQGLLAALNSDNQFWRMHAQRMLVERGNKDVVPQLKAMVANTTLDEIGINAPGIHALWVFVLINLVMNDRVISTCCV